MALLLAFARASSRASSPRVSLPPSAYASPPPPLPSPPLHHDGLFSVAPMMDYTDRWWRKMFRSLSARATLYTEMVPANTIVHCSEEELPRFLANAGASEAPVVLQIGGADPQILKRAVHRALPWGYSGFNLNCGCPSDRVAGSGAFGAALMDRPSLVASLCKAMAEEGGGGVSVKCRIGVTRDKARASEVDDEATYVGLRSFVREVSEVGGVTSFQVHARKAVLGGLSPAQNRQVPPLRYNLVHRLASDFPHLSFFLNGGIESFPQAKQALREAPSLAGVMVGRAVIARPWEWAQLDTQLFGAHSDPAASRRVVLEAYAAFIDEEEAATPHRIRRKLLAPALLLFSGDPHGKQYRKRIDELAREDSLSAGEVLLQSARNVLLDATLDAPPGYMWSKEHAMYVPPAHTQEEDDMPSDQHVLSV